jgi:lysophospholipase L1-like esterase
MKFRILYGLLLLISPGSDAWGARPATGHEGTYAVPYIPSARLNHPEWIQQAFYSQIIGDETGRITTQANLSAFGYFAWKTDTLCFAIEVSDDSIVGGPGGDQVELFLVDKPGGKNMVQWIVGVNPNSWNAPTIQTWDHRGSRKVTPLEPVIKLSFVPMTGGYRLTAFIPLAIVDVATVNDAFLGFQIHINDSDDPGSSHRSSLHWFYAGNSYRRSDAHQTLQLAYTRSLQVKHAVKCYLLDSTTVILKVLASKTMVGEDIQVGDSLQTLATGTLSDSLDYAVFTTSLPLNMSGNPDLPKKVFISNKLAGIIDFGTLDLVNENRKGSDFDDEVSLFLTADRRHKPPENSILFVGHSFFRYWLTLEDDMQGFYVLNRAFGGARVENILHFYNVLFVPYHPRVIVLIIGGNDLNMGYPPDTVFRDFTLLLDKLHRDLPTTRLIALTNSELYYGVKNLKQFDERLFEFATLNPWLRVCDIRYEVDIKNDACLQTLMMPDRVHYNHKGYLHFTKKVREAVASAVSGSETVSDSFKDL